MSNTNLVTFWDEFYRKINTYYYVMVMLPFFIFIIKFLPDFEQYQPIRGDLKKIIQSQEFLVSITISIVWIVTLLWYLSKKTRSVVRISELKERLSTYKTIFLYYTLGLQFFALTVVIVYYFTGIKTLVFIYGTILVMNSMQRPSDLRLYRILKISKEQKNDLRGVENK